MGTKKNRKPHRLDRERRESTGEGNSAFANLGGQQLCKECNLRPRQHCSSRCAKCSEEYKASKNL